MAMQELYRLPQECCGEIHKYFWPFSVKQCKLSNTMICYFGSFCKVHRNEKKTLKLLQKVLFWFVFGSFWKKFCMICWWNLFVHFVESFWRYCWGNHLENFDSILLRNFLGSQWKYSLRTYRYAFLWNVC